MKKKIIVFFTIVLLVFISLPLFNYYVDIARVFSKSYDKHHKGQLANELFLQNQFLMEHPEYTKVLLGSSRVGNGIDLTQNDGWYKAWHQGANLDEHLNTLKYLLYKDKKIDEVMIAVDYLSFFSEADKSDYFRQNAPIGIKNSIDFYNFYLFRKPTKKDFKYFVKNKLIPNRKHIFSNEAQSVSKKDDYFKNQDIFMSNRKINEKTFYKNIKALQDIKQICDSKGIKFSFYVNPFHYKNYYGQDLEFILKYKEELAKIDSYSDCSLDIDKYTVDSQYWVDVSHYNSKLGNLVLKDIFDNSEVVCKNINLSNVGDINQKSLKENAKILSDLTWNDIKILPHQSYLSKKIYENKIEASNNHYLLRYMPNSNTYNKKLFIKMHLKINKPTEIRVELGGKSVVQKIEKFDGWPKVSKDQIVGVVIDEEDLLQNKLVYKANQKTRFYKIEIFQMKEF